MNLPKTSRETHYPVNWLILISPMHSETSMTEPSIPGPIPVHVAYSPLTSMNLQWTINPHDRYPSSCTLIPGVSIPTSSPPLCNLQFAMFHSGVNYTHLSRETNPDPPSLDPPKWEMASSFSWSCPFKCPTSRTLCLHESRLDPYCMD